MAGGLVLGPRWLYPAKAVATTSRSVTWLARTRGRVDSSGIRILFYHRVASDSDELAVTPEKFAHQMRELARRGYAATDVASVARALDGHADPRGLVGLSFDDGYQDVADHAGPVLRELGFRATVYIPTGVTDGRATFTWYEQQPPLMSWSTIGELDAESTFAFEAHTVTHPNLLQLSDGEARREIVDSKAELEDRLGHEVTSFCYPAGLFGARERRYVEEAGFESAVSCEPGVNTPATDRLALLRRQVDRRDTPLDFRAKVAGAHDTPPLLRAAYRRARYGAGTV